MKKIVASILTAVMLLSLVPMIALATSDSTEDFIPVTGLKDMPTTVTIGPSVDRPFITPANAGEPESIIKEPGPVVRLGSAVPENATNQYIVWSISDPGDTGAEHHPFEWPYLMIPIPEHITVERAGTFKVKATIKNGLADGVDYVEEFEIKVVRKYSFWEWLIMIFLFGWIWYN